MMSKQVFSINNVLKVAKSNKGKDMKEFCEVINNNFDNIICKPYEGTTLVHIQFGHPLNVQSNK